MSLGTAIKTARERRRLSQRQLAALAGVSSSFVTRLESDRANPTWHTIEMLAAALDAAPVLQLVPSDAAVAGAAAMVTRTTPIERLRRQHQPALATLSSFESFKVPFVVAGAAAALLQGFPTPVCDLRILVEDSDDALIALEALLRAEQVLFDEFEPAALRPIVERSWSLYECEVAITLADPLPASVAIELSPGFVVPVLPPHALLADPEVASILRLPAVRSSPGEQSGFGAV